MQASTPKLIVVCLEGCHGCGKTSLIAEFEARGFRVLDEAFLDMPAYALHPQTLLMETSWVCSWFERVLRIASRVRNAKHSSVFIADRSPFSAVFYSNSGHLLEPLIRAQMQEVEEYSSVQFHTVHVKVEPELLWQRILSRLEREPERARLNEDKRSWMEQTLEFYRNFQWDLAVQNNQDTIAELADAIIARLCARDPAFADANAKSKLRCLCDSSSVSTDSDEELCADGTMSAVSSTVADEEDFGRSIISFNNVSAEDRR